MRKQILFILACISLILVAQTPQRFPGGVVSSKYVVTNSTNDSVLLGAGGRKAVNSIVTDTSHLSARINAKAALSGATFTGNISATNLSGTNTGDETLTSIKTKLGAASASNSGYLTNTDWSTFNGKQSALTLGNFTSNTSGITIGNGTGAVVGPGVSLAISTADATHDGLLSYGNFNAFNNKVSFPGFGTTTGKVWGYDSHPTTIGGYGITDAVSGSGLSTNYIPKWNGSSFVNSAFRSDASNSFVDLKTTITGASGGDVLILNKASGAGNLAFYNDGVYGGQIDCASGIMNLYSASVKVQSTAASTSPVTGALIVGGGIGAGGNVTASGFKTPTGTSSQFLKADGSSDSNTYLTSAAIEYGNFTPTITNQTNSSSGTVTTAIYSRVGNSVHVVISGSFVNTSANSYTSILLSMPPPNYAIINSVIVGIGHIVGYSNANNYIPCKVSLSAPNVLLWSSNPIAGDTNYFEIQYDFYTGVSF